MKIKSELSTTQLDHAVKGLQAIAHPVRFQILNILSKEKKSVGELVELLEASQSAVSQHLSKMKSFGILQSTKNSNSVIYSLKDPKFKELSAYLIRLYKNK